MDNVVALSNDRAAAFRIILVRKYEKVDHVLSSLIDQCGRGATGQVIEATADQCESLRPEVDNRR